jgi:C4-dicarboxylate-specific signal transduction histidine kinase
MRTEATDVHKTSQDTDEAVASSDMGSLEEENRTLREQLETLQRRVRQDEERRRAMSHIMGDLSEANKRLSDQRKAMIHILLDYEQDRRRLAQQAERLDNSRRALLHILQDVHSSKQRLEGSRKAMIHIMGDLRETTDEVRYREQELRDKQEQLVQAAKLATLGELTTGVAHELNNPLNNIALFMGNIFDQLEMGVQDGEQIKRDLSNAQQQVRKATEIISHLRTFGRATPMSRERVAVNDVIQRSVALLHEQLRMREIDVVLDLDDDDPYVLGNAIQLEQVFVNLLTNARDAVAEAITREIRVTSTATEGVAQVTVSDTGPGIPVELAQRIFDPFFTTKDVGAGTGLGLSITYSIVQEHQGSIAVSSQPGEGAVFTVRFPLSHEEETMASVP